MTHPPPQRGFTIIELLIICAILGILAFIAIPAYSDYVARELQVNEGLQLTRGWRDSVSRYHAENGGWPSVDDLKSHSVVTDLSGPYVEAVTLEETGVIEITYGGRKADPRIHGRVLELVPYTGPKGDAIWHCHTPATPGTALPALLLPDFCRGSTD